MWYNQGMNKQQGVSKSSLKQEVSYGVCVCVGVQTSSF